MATANKKSIKPLVSILPLEPKDIDTFWPLAEFRQQTKNQLSL